MMKNKNKGICIEVGANRNNFIYKWLGGSVEEFTVYPTKELTDLELLEFRDCIKNAVIKIIKSKQVKNKAK